MCEAYSGAEGHEEIIAAEGGADAYREDGEEEVEDDEGRAGDVASLVRETQESVGEVADYETDCYAEDALVENGYEEPFFQGLFCAGLFQGPDSDEEEGE